MNRVIKVLSERISTLQSFIEKREREMEEPELISDLIWGANDIVNAIEEMDEIQEAVKLLLKTKK